MKTKIIIALSAVALVAFGIGQFLEIRWVETLTVILGGIWFALVLIGVTVNILKRDVLKKNAWLQFIEGAGFIIIFILVLRLYNLPPSVGKVLAYCGLAFIPSITIGYRDREKINHSKKQGHLYCKA